MDVLVVLFVVLVILWAVGAFVVPVGGSFIHLLIVIALVIAIIRMLQGRKVI